MILGHILIFPLGFGIVKCPLSPLCSQIGGIFFLSFFFIPNISHLCCSDYPEYSASQIDLPGAVGERLRESEREQHQRSLRAVSCVLLYFHLLPVAIGKSPCSPLIRSWLSFLSSHPSSWKLRKTNRFCVPQGHSSSRSTYVPWLVLFSQLDCYFLDI